MRHVTPTKPTMHRGAPALEWRAAQGEYLRSLREARGLTQTDVVDALGITAKQTISHIETGRINCPPDWIPILAKLYRVPKKEFAAALLRWQNPYIYAAIFGADPALQSELARASSRYSVADE